MSDQRAEAETTRVSVYRVGVLHDGYLAYTHAKNGRLGEARGRVRASLRYLLHVLRSRRWRSLRNAFNGYLAEVDYPPIWLAHERCGRGWTRAAARRSLRRHLLSLNPPEVVALVPGLGDDDEHAPGVAE